MQIRKVPLLLTHVILKNKLLGQKFAAQASTALINTVISLHAHIFLTLTCFA